MNETKKTKTVQWRRAEAVEGCLSMDSELLTDWKLRKHWQPGLLPTFLSQEREWKLAL